MLLQLSIDLLKLRVMLTHVTGFMLRSWFWRLVLLGKQLYLCVCPVDHSEQEKHVAPQCLLQLA